MRKWALLAIGAVVLVGTSIALAVTGSGTTSEYATIASFFVAVPVAVASVISIAEARSKAKDDDQKEPEPETIRTGTTNVNITNAGVVQTAPNAVADVYIDNAGNYQPDRPKRRPHLGPRPGR